MKTLLQNVLFMMARATLRRHRPLIVGVTGSIGKTTTKAAIAVVLQKKYRVRENIKSYNNEIGVPLTILGFESPGRSLPGWLQLVLQWAWGMVFGHKHYPEVLVLEMGADKPGDIAYLTSLAPPDIGVLTAIAPTHLEQFGDVAAVAAEKRLLIKNIRHGGTAVLNSDDEIVRETKISKGERLLRYGMSQDAEVRGSDVRWSFGSGGDGAGLGVNFKVTHEGSSVPMRLDGCIGLPPVLSALAAAAVGVAVGLNLVEISEALKIFSPTPGRLRLLEGIRHSLIIDDSYNSSPRAVIAALDVLDSAPRSVQARHIAVLGDMRELGDEAESAHTAVGQDVAQRPIDMLVTVGERSRSIARAARHHGFAEDKIFSFATAEEAGGLLRDTIRPDDVVLFKGSQNFIRLERAVKMIMAAPERASELLVRQGPEWQGKP